MTFGTTDVKYLLRILFCESANFVRHLKSQLSCQCFFFPPLTALGLFGFLGLVNPNSPWTGPLLPLLAILIAFSRIPSSDSWVVTAIVLSSPLFSSDGVFVWYSVLLNF